MRKRLFFTALIFFASVSYAQALTASEVQEKFSSANEYYRGKQYEKAIELYEEIIQSGWKNGVIYYNLANSYFKAGRLGKAIANYERAGKFLKRDQDFHFNFQYVKGQVLYSVKPLPKNVFERLFERHVAFYTEMEMVAVILILLFFLSAVHLVSLYLNWRPRKRVILMVFLFFMLLVFAYGWWLEVNINKNKGIVIKKEQAMFEPSGLSTVHFELNEGNKVFIEAEVDDWIKVKRNDGKMGWVMKDAVEKI